MTSSCWLPAINSTSFSLVGRISRTTVLEAIERSRSRGFRESAAHSRIFDSVKNPIKEVFPAITDEAVAELIDRIEVLPTDFSLTPSENRTSSIAQCRKLLVTEDPSEAIQLWQTIVDAVGHARITHGTVTLDELWSELAAEFSLKGHPNYGASWVHLNAHSSEHKESIQSTIKGVALSRDSESTAITAVLKAPVCVVYGESGCGKSAIVRDVLDADPSVHQVWLGQDTLESILSAPGRATLKLDYTPETILKATTRPRNVLVLNSAERLRTDEAIVRARSLVGSILGQNRDAGTAWSVVVIGQTDAWLRGTLQRIANAAPLSSHHVKPLADEEVREVLSASAELGWVTSHSEIVKALTNPRTLAWVLEAEGSFVQDDASALTSLTSIAERLWNFWTQDKPSFQRTLMRFGEREANFEHSFPISELSDGDLATLENKPPQLPLVIDKYKHAKFQHDLAAEWSRYQLLKGMAYDTDKWSAYAANPLWLGALRMLGGFLLRDTTPDGKNGWDVVFAKTQSSSAGDVLLDALCLDTDAETFLAERVEILFAERAKLLNRLLHRFAYVATVPGGANAVLSKMLLSDPSYALYVEAQYRSPMPGRWPAMVRFLKAQEARIAELISPVVSGVCEKWLSNIPETYAGQPFPLRKELAEVALSTARALQLEQSKERIYIHDAELPIYSAALAGFADLPDEVSTWALEMARRQPVADSISAAVKAHRAQKSKAHAEKLASDPEYKAQHEKRLRASSVSLSSFRTKLPFWPDGPQGRS